MKTKFLLFSLLSVWFPMVRGAEPASVREESIDWVAEMFKGGFTAVILMLLAFGGLVIFIERLIVVRNKNFLPADLERKIQKLVHTSDFNGIRENCGKDPSALAQVATYIASHTHIPFEILSFGVMDMIGRTVSRQHQRTYPLAVVATLAPLLGLLGTMIGMIESFQKVALMGDTGDASILADSIGKALITTAIGLSVAIPSLAAYHYFKSRINHFGIRLEESVDNLMSPWLHPEVAADGDKIDPGPSIAT
ncbi:MAG: MotA/TolQ/ExbB proton channel family protein [Opitutales bacterium]